MNHSFGNGRHPTYKHGDDWGTHMNSSPLVSSTTNVNQCSREASDHPFIIVPIEGFPFSGGPENITKY